MSKPQTAFVDQHAIEKVVSNVGAGHTTELIDEARDATSTCSLTLSISQLESFR
jgi:hypothetical protein